MTDHLGHDKPAAVSNSMGSARNDKSHKTFKGDFGELPIDIHRDHDGRFGTLIVVNFYQNQLFNSGNFSDILNTNRFF